MAFVCEVVHFDTASSVNLPLTKFSASEMPKMVIFLTMNSSALGSGVSPTMCLGFETSAGSRFTAAQAYTDNQTNQARASAHVDSTTYGFQWGYQSSVTGQTIVARATVTAWASTGLTVTFSLAPGTPIKCAAFVLGGSHFTAGTPRIITQSSSTSDTSITDMGFNPNGMFVINGTIAASGETAHSWIGAVDADGNQMGIWGLSNGFGNGVRRKQRLDCLGFHSWNGSEYSRLTWKAWQSGGCVLGNPLAYTGARYALIPFYIDPAAGRCELDVQSWASTSLQTQTVSSGYTPVGLFGLGYCGASSASDLTTAVALGVGFTDFDTHACGTLYVSGTYPSVSRCGLHFDSDSYYAGFSAYNTEAHQLVPSSTTSGQYVVYPALQAGQQVGTLAFLSADPPSVTGQPAFIYEENDEVLTGRILSRERLASLSSSTALTSATYAGANAFAIAAETKNVRMMLTGGTPTASSGMLLKTTDPPRVIKGVNLADVRLIEVEASAAVEVEYWVIY